MLLERLTCGLCVVFVVQQVEDTTEFGFVMEGPALINVLGKKAMEVMLFDVMRQCKAVIACRVSPKQKAQLVRHTHPRLLSRSGIPSSYCLWCLGCV